MIKCILKFGKILPNIIILGRKARLIVVSKVKNEHLERHRLVQKLSSFSVLIMHNHEKICKIMHFLCTECFSFFAQFHLHGFGGMGNCNFFCIFHNFLQKRRMKNRAKYIKFVFFKKNIDKLSILWFNIYILLL